MAFRFNPTIFVAGAEDQTGDYDEPMRGELAKLRTLYPELASWGDLAIEAAWSAYSLDICAVSWVYWINERDNGFLSYLFIRTKNPGFKFGGTGLFDSKVWDLGDTQPWLTDAPLPSWAI